MENVLQQLNVEDAHGNTILGTIRIGIGEWHTKEGGLNGSTSRRTIVSMETKGGG
jgi:hypothetical protein